MTVITRRTALARATLAGATLAAALRPGKLRAQPLQGIDALHPLPEPRPLDLQWTAADGTTHGLADYAGRGVVLNLWATWCVPCVREMPALDDLARRLAPQRIAVLAISSDRGGAPAVQRFYDDHAITHLPVLLDPGSKLAHTMAVRGIPTTFLINPQGQEIAWLEGSADWSSDDAIEVIRHIQG